MAKIFHPLLSEKASGKMGGVVHLTTKGLNVARSYVKPKQPNSPAQAIVKGNFGELSANWSNVLTDDNRATWNNFTIKVTDIYGEPIKMSGINLYKSVGQILALAGKTIPPTAPTLGLPPEISATYDPASATASIVVKKISSGEVTKFAPFLSIEIANGASNAGTVDNVTSIHMAGGKSSRKVFKKDFRHVCFIDENSTTDQTIDLLNPAGAPLTVGKKVDVKVTRYSKEGLNPATSSFSFIISA
jgi:hypothetical protein